MDPIAQELCLPRQYEPSQSFYEDVKNLLSPYCPMVNVQRQNLLQYQPPPEPIEMLFIDAMKSWDLAAKIITCFFPLLMKRRRIMASPIGGRAIMRDMLRVADEFGVEPVIEKFPMRDVNAALQKVRDNTIRYRAVLTV